MDWVECYLVVNKKDVLKHLITAMINSVDFIANCDRVQLVYYYKVNKANNQTINIKHKTGYNLTSYKQVKLRELMGV